ncbi:hypothetical protein ERJ75_001221700 [Trypanosoma vivax]|uniref:Uncharacterized protein n=1 Tax=Trypanosoma vivax (strain Y486) TaxID=1055687 RepID=G0U161_TRYVY|nr:hypothetical protein TRVL_03427 [Trypanosoma vivax]KAH8609240.1 hypothetical protein ERJ75_001221700 [Trypanosoma vivax]CCC49816.1 conserved hypothetical protein [Trypanosoma vivax Y486]
MSVIDVKALFGRPLLQGSRVTVVCCLDYAIVVGTETGCMLVFGAADPREVTSAFANGGDGAATATACDKMAVAPAIGDCVYARALHNGPIHCLSASAAHLFASAGHDATAVVQPLSNLLSNSDESFARFHGHTTAIAATVFFSNGTWLATCSISGRLIIFDTTSRSRICDVRAGFLVRCLALSQDETSCFVGGTQLAQIDLYDNMRPVDPLLQRSTPTWLRRYSWLTDKHSHGTGVDVVENIGGPEDDSESYTTKCPEDLIICELHLTADRLAAVFKAKDSVVESSGAVATWCHGAANFWLSCDFRIVPNTCSYLLSRGLASGATESPPFSHIRVGDRVINEQGKTTVPLVPRVLDGWDSWQRNRVRVLRHSSIHSVVPSSHSAADHALPPYSHDSLASEKERGRRLQMECDELVHQLKVLVNSDKRKKRQRQPTGA